MNNKENLKTEYKLPVIFELAEVFQCEAERNHRHVSTKEALDFAIKVYQARNIEKIADLLDIKKE